MDGFIRLNRKFFTNAYWSQQRTFSLSEAWLDLIQMARFDAEPAMKELPNGRLITIKRGEIHAGLRFLSDRWGWSVEKTQRYINKHIQKHEIERRTEQGESILTLCNYEYYNPLEDTVSNTIPNTMSNTPPKNPYTALTPTRTKKKKEEEYIPPYSPPVGGNPAAGGSALAGPRSAAEPGYIPIPSESSTQSPGPPAEADETVSRRRFRPPRTEEVAAYCAARNNGIDPAAFMDFYESKGWMVGRNKMKNWQAAVRTWERKRKTTQEEVVPRKPLKLL